MSDKDSDLDALAEAAVRTAVDLRRSGRLTGAESALRRILHKRPDHAAANCELGQTLLEQGKNGEAKQCVERALKYAPRMPQAHNRLGVVYSSLNEHEKALECYSRAHELAPRDASFLMNLGGALLTRGRHREAISRLQEASRLRPDWILLHLRLGQALALVGRQQEAVAEFGAAVVVDPHSVHAQTGLADCLASLGREDEALHHLGLAMAGKPSDARQLNAIGAVWVKLRRYADALSLFEAATSAAPDFVDAQANIAATFQALGLAEKAIARCEVALRLRPNKPGMLLRLGSIYFALAKFEEALDCFSCALVLAPSFALAHCRRAQCLVHLGRLDEGRAEFERAVTLGPNNLEILAAVLNDKTVEPGDEHLLALERLATTADLNAEDQIALRFALGKAYKDLGLTNDCFREMLAANTLKRGLIQYDEPMTAAMFDRVSRIFSKKYFSQFEGSGESSRRPIFIVGMPRSGTTLVEQILASHPDVYGAGELPHVLNIAASLYSETEQTYPEAALGLTREQVGALGRSYLRSVASSSTETRFTDKMPGNFLFLGLIHAMLPEAKVICLNRDPLDTCLSCFFTQFGGPHPYSYDLRELGHYYRSFEGLMTHWREVIPPAVILHVRYELLVHDLQTETRKLLAHCGLEWSDQCLNFHGTQRASRTASARQVRRPLYASSVGSAKPYIAFLEPLIAALQSTSTP